MANFLPFQRYPTLRNIIFYAISLELIYIRAKAHYSAITKTEEEKKKAISLGDTLPSKIDESIRSLLLLALIYLFYWSFIKKTKK